jgi:hypothetical protein
MGLGSLLFALPHFLTETYNPTAESRQKSVALCNMSLSCGLEEAVRS